MKYYKFLFVLMVIFTTLLTSCEEEDKIIYNPENVVAAIISGPDEINLDINTPDAAIEFTWTEAKYDINVEYQYVVDLVVNDTTIELYRGKELGFTISNATINQKLVNNLELEPEIELSVSFSVYTDIGENAVDVKGNDLSFNLTPYAIVFPPIYMVGDATGGWNWDSEVIVPGTKPNFYTTLAHFTNEKAFRFFAQEGWDATSYNYPYFEGGTVSNLFENANDGDQNFKFTGATGWYRISVDLKTLTIEMEEADEPLLFMTGAALGGWDWNDNFVKLKFVQDGIWMATTDFANGEAFRFFGQQDWAPVGYNYPYFSNGTVSNLFENAGDGDSNFRFIGTTGEYTITVNLNDFSIVME